jgi:hypothetical protein
MLFCHGLPLATCHILPPSAETALRHLVSDPNAQRVSSNRIHLAQRNAFFNRLFIFLMVL